MDNTLILVFNSGSSSLKFKLFSFPVEEMLAGGQVERIGLEGSTFRLKFKNESIEQKVTAPGHLEAFEHVRYNLKEYGVINDFNQIKIVGHRVVHGGSNWIEPIEINEDVKKGIEEISDLAPLHNPANLSGIINAEIAFANAKHIAVFDTAFHSSIPEVAHRYAIPEKYYKDHHIRVYGFHGTSHEYVSQEWYKNIGITKGKLITLHLGNGSSIAAVKDGKCIDTSLGFSPTDGLIMGTRSGVIDPMVLLYFQDKLGFSSSEVNFLLNKKSGFLGLTGQMDVREIIDLAKNGDKHCNLALEMAFYRIKKYIGAYVAVLNGLDAIIFTAGIGENSPHFRSGALSNLQYLGIELDENLNNDMDPKKVAISKSSSKVEICVIPTNEELAIARKAFGFV